MLVFLRERKSTTNIPPVDLGQLGWCVFINKLIDVQKSTANPDDRLAVFVKLDVNSHLTKLIDTLRLTQKHDLHHLLLSINKSGNSHINGILFIRHIDILKVVVLSKKLLNFSHCQFEVNLLFLVFFFGLF